MLSTQHPQLRIHKNNIRIHCVLEISFNINTYDENRHILFVFLPLPSEGRACMSQDFCPIGRRENYEGGLEGDKTLENSERIQGKPTEPQKLRTGRIKELRRMLWEPVLKAF